MGKRKTIGESPLDAVIPPAESPPKPPPSPKVEKQRLTVHLPADLIERVKNAVYWTPGLTLSGLVEEALTKAVDQLEKERGEPFPPRKEELKRGRPVK